MIFNNIHVRRLVSVVLMLTLTCSFNNLLAQTNVANQGYSDNWTKGHELLKRQDFGGARYCFQLVAEKEKEFSEKRIAAEFYLAYCAIELSRPEAEKKMLSFLDRYSGSSYIHEAHFLLGKQKYKQQQYEKAIGWLERTDSYQVEKDHEDEYLFMMGYSYFKINDFDQAGKYFFDLIDKKGEYQLPANYYYAHVSYEKGNYQTALNAFDKLGDDQRYAPLVPYYISQIYYLQEKYNELLDYAPNLLDKKGIERVSEISKMIGLAYYNQADYSSVIPYLSQEEDNLNREETFALAFSYYKEGDYKNASHLFSKVKGENDAMSQIASYNLADSYLKLGEKEKAKQAFKKASKIDADQAIKKHALFNFAKISYELSYTEANEAISAFDDYLERYPNSDNSDEAYDFLVDVYMSTKNYEQALASMDKVQQKTPRIEEAYQRVAYFYALELIKSLEYDEALKYLDKSLDYKIYDRDIAADCLYWKAEAYYRLQDFKTAIKNYQEFIETPGVGNSKYFNKAYYNLGYCEFELDSYDKAIDWFRKYEQLKGNEGSQYLTDALIRIGDCYFVTRNYDKASEYYDKAAGESNWSAGYAVYQNALSKGLSGEGKKKMALLKNFSTKYPDSEYKDDAMFELAKAKIEDGNEREALLIYDKLILDYPESEYVSKTLLQLGQLNYNKKDYSAAISNYEKVILSYSGTSEAESALMGLKNVYIDMNNVQAYFKFVESLGLNNTVDTSEKDYLSYLSAERLYMNGELEKADKAFSEYMTDFPNGAYRVNAAYYQGESAFNRAKYDEALKAFDKVLENEDNLFTEKALLGASQISFNHKDYVKAKQLYQQLKLKTQIDENKFIADWGLFRCFFELKNYSELVGLSKPLLLSSKSSETERKEVLYKRVKAYLALGDKDLAKADLKELAKDVQSVNGAESRFLLAELFYENKKIDEAEKTINEFIEMNSPHHYWLGKSFILLSDIFVDKKDLFQARYTLQSIIDNYTVKDDEIIQTAKSKLSAILEDDKINEKKDLKKEVKRDSLKKDEVKPVEKKELVEKKEKVDSVYSKDVKSILNEMIEELED